MAKIAKPKKREVSVHSRAARRQATPPAELPASKKSSDENEHWLYNAQNAGVHKKTRGKRGNTRQQHARQAKAMEKADRNFAVLETKVAKSKQQSKKIQARAKDWDELNEELVGTKPRTLINVKDPAAMEDMEEETDVENVAPIASEVSANVDVLPQASASVIEDTESAAREEELDTIT